jgi:DNA polymerase-3 subunit chi
MAEKVAEFVELQSAGDRLPQACARTALHYERGETVSVYAPDPADAAALDELLWTFRQNSFIPHVRLKQATEPLIEPVLICGDEDEDGGAAAGADVLIVLSADQLPKWFAAVPRVLDFAEVYDEKRSQAGRRRYAALKQAGYRMRFIKPWSRPT